MRFTRIASIAIAAIALTSACGSESITVPAQNDAATVVDIFTRLADSVSHSGGDADLGGAYSSLAEAVRLGGRVSPVVITIDGVATTFLATAHQTEIAPLPCVPGRLCNLPLLATLNLRTLIAWQQDNPKRVVQLSSAADSDPIRAYLFPVLVPVAGPSASLVYFDGQGGTFFGSSGSQKVAVTTSNDACAATGQGRPTDAIFSSPPRCTKADFTISFSAKAEPSSFLASRNTATGSHTFAMAAQPVLGARFELAAVAPPLPPISVTPIASLSAELTTATVDSVVALTLKVTNAASTAANVTFGSGQQYDFYVVDAATGAHVWRWSEGMAFTMALGTVTIPANGSLTYSARWKPAKKGSYVAVGSLVSLSHRADAKVMVTVP